MGLLCGWTEFSTDPQHLFGHLFLGPVILHFCITISPYACNPPLCAYHVVSSRFPMSNVGLPMLCWLHCKPANHWCLFGLCKSCSSFAFAKENKQICNQSLPKSRSTYANICSRLQRQRKASFICKPPRHIRSAPRNLFQVWSVHSILESPPALFPPFNSLHPPRTFLTTSEKKLLLLTINSSSSNT